MGLGVELIFVDHSLNSLKDDTKTLRPIIVIFNSEQNTKILIEERNDIVAFNLYLPPLTCIQRIADRVSDFTMA